MRWILIGLGIVVMVGLIWYLRMPSSPDMRQQPPPPVRVATAVQRNMMVTERTIGAVVANATVNVTSQVAGQVMSAEFQEGQIVHEGDVLFRLDPRPFEAALAQAQANLARDQASLLNAQQNQRRYDTLFSQNAISAQQRDQAIAQAGSLAGTVKADEAAVALAKLNLEYSVIQAPVDGKTGPIEIQPGNLVKANDANPLVVITQIEPVKVSFSLPQADLPRIQQQLENHRLIATVKEQGEAGVTLTAPVDFIDNNVSAQTGTIQLRATFQNEDGRLVPGELVDVSVDLNELHNVTVVPSQSVNIGPDGRYVYVLKNGDVPEMNAVGVLFDDGTSAAVSGKVKPGDKVITLGQLRIEPGHPVSVINGENTQSKGPRPGRRRRQT